MSGPASILIRLMDGDTVVHEFRRSTSQPTTEGVRRLLSSSMGWMQSYEGQVTAEQWKMEADRARRAQER